MRFTRDYFFHRPTIFMLSLSSSFFITILRLSTAAIKTMESSFSSFIYCSNHLSLWLHLPYNMSPVFKYHLTVSMLVTFWKICMEPWQRRMWACHPLPGQQLQPHTAPALRQTSSKLQHWCRHQVSSITKADIKKAPTLRQISRKLSSSTEADIK